MFRKIASVLLLSIGSCFLITLPSLFPIVFEQGGFAFIIILIFAAIGSSFIVAGLALWDWSRWRIVSKSSLIRANAGIQIVKTRNRMQLSRIIIHFLACH